MNLSKLLSQYFWLVCVAFSVANFVWGAWFRSATPGSNVDPEMRRKYLAWYWAMMAFPFLVMGIGQVFGGVPNVWAYFRPQDGNPWVWLFYAAILLVYVVWIWWLLLQDGARIASELQLVTFTGFGRERPLSAFWFKVIAILMLPFFAAWLWMASRMDVRVPF